MCEIKTKIGDYDEMNKWKEELSEEQQKKVEQTEKNHFWIGTLFGALGTALLAAVLRK